jgi:predicted ATP-dependent endonuclease of OLD family
MPSIIAEIRLINYKRFRDYTIEPNPRINILVGENEVGKSSILEAIDLVTSGNVRKVEAIGIDKLINIEAVDAFKAGERSYENLPKMMIELYLSGNFNHTMNGRNNSKGVVCDGIRLVCTPNQDFQTAITESLQETTEYFPYDYYSIRFSTFADEGYNGYKKQLRSILIDSSNMNSDYATNDFIKRMYGQYTEDDIKERAVHKGKYRQLKERFRTDSLEALNSRIPPEKKYTFGLKPSSVYGLESDLMIYEDNIGIDSKGTGKQVFIKTDFALERSGENVDVVLIEEPENHLSHVNLRKLIQRVAETQSGQLFVATHSSMISTRLELRNLLIMHTENTGNPVSLSDLDKDTAKYFMKAPVAGILEFVISDKVILVEGPSEYMLFERFYKSVAGNKPELDEVSIIDVHGLSFKRYLEVAQLLCNKVAVITDNDKDPRKNCEEKYIAFVGTNIEVFYETDASKYTFEVVLYGDNGMLCDTLFGDEAQTYMLNNKTESAYTLLEQEKAIAVPDYIRRAIEWIKR